jgi:hypothetical protein
LLMPEANAYETRIVAYADILGWSEATKQTTKDVSQWPRLLKAVTSIAGHASSFSLENKVSIKKTIGVPQRFVERYDSIEFSYFSDNFAVSAPIANAESLFKIIAFAYDTLLHERFLVRGGITVGDVYHNQGTIFGPALLEAVAIEQNEALYPRFLCSQKLIDLLNGASYFGEFFLQDCCQEWIVNIACGSLINRDDLMKLIESESHKIESAERKWRYVQTMLPNMFLLKSIN